MSLIDCPECGGKISTSASECPSCGSASLTPSKNPAAQVQEKQSGKEPPAKNAKDPYRLTGTILNGKYTLVAYAGSGGMGAVYRAVRVDDEVVFAVKVLKPDVVAISPEYADLFERETTNARRLDHPHIVKIFDGGKDDDLSYMVMEWIEGNTLEDEITQAQLSLDRITNIFGQVCSAVASAHDKGVIHLDLKPGNVLLLDKEEQGDFVKVIDFGLSRVIRKESQSTVTKFRGTPHYCAPEQFGGKVSYRSDIYSLGATLYYLITGVLPFGASYINAKMHPNLELPEIPPVTRQRAVPSGVDQVIKKALNKDPNLRQQSALELFEQFKEAMTTDALTLKDDTRGEKVSRTGATKSTSRNSPVRVSFYLVYVLIILLGAWTLYKGYVTWKRHEEFVDRFVGIKPPEENDDLFMSLVNAIDNRFSPIVSMSLADKPQSYKVQYLKDASLTQATNGDWISYQGAFPPKVNYGAANFSKSYPSNPPESMKQQTNNGGGRTFDEEDDSEERYVSDVILSDIINECAEKHINDYASYSNVVWETFFHEKKPEYLDVGKVFIGSEKTLAVFPYRALEYKLDVKSRDWWKAAYGVEASDYYALISRSGNAGLTTIYPDVISENGANSLNRTIWFKFTKYGKKFVLGVDVRVVDLSFKLLNEIWYELIALGVLCLLLPYVVYAQGRSKVS